MKQLFILSVILTFLTARGVAQPYQINGRVLDAGNGMAMDGVTVASINGIAKVSTDPQGIFTLRLTSLPDTITVTMVGYESQRFPITMHMNWLDIRLVAANTLLHEVIVHTGYQNIPKERATGSFTNIDGDLLAEQVQTNVLAGLAVLANGVSTGKLNDRGALPQLRVRGMSTLQGPPSPLIVVDNFPFEGDLGNINPNDVDNITILKDAAASSIWGARAGNGVIVITTKRAKYGQRMQADITSNLKVTPIPDLFYNPRISSDDIITVEQFLFANEYRVSDTAHRDHPPFSAVYELLFRARNGGLSEEALQTELNRLRTIDVRQEYADEFFRHGLNQQYALNLRSGSDNHGWNTSAAYDHNRSTLDDVDKRLSLRYNTTSKLTNYLTLTTGINFVWNKSRSGKPKIGSIQQANVGLPPYTTFRGPDGQPLPFYSDYRQSYVNAMASNPDLLDWNYYPTEDWREDRTYHTMLHGQLDAGLTYRILPSLRAELKYQFHKQQRDNQADRGLASYYTRNLINTFYQPTSNMYGVPVGGILNYSNAQIHTHNYRGQLTLGRSWGRHEVSAIAGGEVRNVNRNTSAGRYYGYDRELLTSTPVNYLERYRHFVSNRQQNVQYYDVLSAGINRYVSIYGNGAYSYDRRYTVSFSARRDASNIFGARTNNRWTPLWSAGLAWTADQEEFYTLGWLPRLKLRATYGYSGNIDPSLSAVTTLSYMYTSIYTGTPVAAVDRFYNPDLRWEKVRQINLAADFTLQGDWINGSFEFYMKDCTDLYGPSPVDYSSGIGVATITKNVANMRARGIDLQLHTVNTKGRVRWTTTLNASHYIDRVTNYHLGVIPVQNLVNSDGAVHGVEGKPVHGIFSYAWAGLDPETGDPLGYGQEGTPTSDYNYLTNGTTIGDLVFHGSTDPRYFGSLGNTVSWRNISMSVYVSYRLGHYFRMPTISYGNLFGNLEGHTDYLERWQRPGDERHTQVPSLVYPLNSARDIFYQRSDIHVERADNIRLQYVNLSYQIRNAKVYLNCNNLGLIWAANDKGIDPDYGSNAIPLGMDVAFGIRLSF